jgi:hypothetical protein
MRAASSSSAAERLYLFGALLQGYAGIVLLVILLVIARVAELAPSNLSNLALYRQSVTSGFVEVE